jgi:hypothetical protein
MEWRKLKNIILIILLVLNLALAALIGGPKLSAYARENQAQREAVLFLEQKGIGISPELIPDDEGHQPLVARRDQQGEEELARLVLGEHVLPEPQGGEVYRYTSEKGVLQFHSDGSFWAELAPEYFPVEQDGRSAALAVLEQLNFTGEVMDEGPGYLTVRQCLGEACLFNQQATVTWTEKGLTGIAPGRRLYGALESGPGWESIDRATALIAFYNGLNRMGDVCRQIDRVEPGYISATSLERVMTLTPVWRVTTDTGTYQLNLVDGGLERMG